MKVLLSTLLLILSSLSVLFKEGKSDMIFLSTLLMFIGSSTMAFTDGSIKASKGENSLHTLGYILFICGVVFLFVIAAPEFVKNLKIL